MKHFRPKKRFSQHFLNNKRVAKRIVDFAKIEDEVVLEIGSGKGILTRQIAERAKKVFAVEIDRTLIKALEKINLPNIEVVNKDFLRLNLKDFSKPAIVGNIPYSITTQIFEKLIEQRAYVGRATLTVQKEYGERMLAEIGSHQYGSMTLCLNYYFQVEKAFTIPPKYFSPQPRVSSSVISLTKRKLPFKVKDEAAFFAFIQGIFRYRRKFLKNAIINYLHRLPEGIDETNLKKRPADLTVNDFYLIYNRMRRE